MPRRWSSPPPRSPSGPGPSPRIIISLSFSPLVVLIFSSAAPRSMIAGPGSVPPASRTAGLRAGDRVRRDRDRLALGLDPAVEGDDDQAAIGDGERHEPAPEHALLRRGDEAAQLLARLQGGGHVRSDPVVELGHDVSRWRPS